MAERKEAGMSETMRRLCLAAAKVRYDDPETTDADWTEEAFDGLSVTATVRAVLSELREPTDDMLAPFHEGPPGMVLVARGVWQAMIDRALAEEPPHA